ncbi:hypothetical protein HC823_00075 [Candidatus Gracilibacteria bacterium]|nr:hypothetical protein [Candidatus Gracilibacteria bacterium]
MCIELLVYLLRRTKDGGANLIQKEMEEELEKPKKNNGLQIIFLVLIVATGLLQILPLLGVNPRTLGSILLVIIIFVFSFLGKRKNM